MALNLSQTKNFSLQSLKESKIVANTTNGGFDEATWGKLDVTRWQGSVQDGVYQLTNYTGDGSDHVIVPNEADFEKAGKSTNGLQVGITRDTVHSLFFNEGHTIAFSKTNNEKVKAVGTDWSYAFSIDHTSSNKFDGSNLDVSSVTNMRGMFDGTPINDLTSLVNWNTSNVTNMERMFEDTSISDLTPLSNWDTSNVTDMSYMFASNSISDLTPLSNWDTSNVTDMTTMFNSNLISDLTPLSNWNTGNVIDMNSMFESNQISDLTPLANWNVSKVTDMSVMFNRNSISDLTPLANWNVSNGTSMGRTFAYNPDIIDLKPISNWNVRAVGIFLGNTKLNLTNINNTPLMQSSLKTRDALYGATFITNNADLVRATIGQDLPNLTNTAKRTIIFNLPHVAPETIVQRIYYKTNVPVQVNFDSRRIVKTYPVKDVKDVKESDWQLDTSKRNDDVIIDGVIYFKPVKIPHINGYKAHLIKDPVNPAMLLVSFFALPKRLQNNQSNNVQLPQKPAEPIQTKPADDKQVDQVINQISYTLMHNSSSNANRFEPDHGDSASLEASSDSTQKDDTAKTQKVNTAKHKKHIIKKRAVKRRRKHAKKYRLKRRSRKYTKHSRKHTKRVKHTKKRMIKHRKRASRKFRKYNLKHIKKA